MKVKRQVLHDGKSVVEVVSSFLYRGRFTDFKNTFEDIQEPDYTVEVKTKFDVGVLKLMEWFDWEDDMNPLQRVSLIFRLTSEVSYKGKALLVCLGVRRRLRP